MSNSPPIEEQEYWELWTSSRDADAGNILVKKYMPLVSYHVQRIAVGLPRNVSREELKSLGLVGLLDALNKFDISRDLKFDTYASFRIRGAIIDGLRKEDWLPRSTREKVKKIEATSNQLEQRLMRHASTAEIAAESGFSEDEVCKTLNEYFFSSVLSMDEHIQDHEESESGSHVIKDEETPTPEEQLVKNEWLKELTIAITRLNENEQLVLSLFYKEELTFTEIGEIIQLSTSRISQIHSKALFKLRSFLLKQTP
ncbi:FliA/WhiG family RNA polymerase sigma factor [Lederbergia citrea]|uniref:FliA/WhiG family RNA polymerase sigma factor n=1 Tax=Lederbergia citrea TaxID=2833581 RepID=A0A942Z3S3_9BACI|nr:FliA/WhiG family RNA polymerase sigma factor [Lederbergia citrea]MBS4177097.1 FliA/WhiG family RNA polymerase sigma factor [Lederbergia citrea]MBS4203760.1 FliA/WhiG family RNA polymerase sigma factor [Lederbergia citrea]MBS4221655.1 FliA/WhiG family RNA polymerase sigma factor [Lederbergia citrea]